MKTRHLFYTSNELLGYLLANRNEPGTRQNPFT